MVPHGEDALTKNYCQQKNSISTTFPWQPVFFFIQLCIPFYLLNFRNYHLNLDCIIFFAFTRWENHKIYGGLIKKFQFAKYLSLKENVHLG